MYRECCTGPEGLSPCRPYYGVIRFFAAGPTAPDGRSGLQGRSLVFPCYAPPGLKGYGPVGPATKIRRSRPSYGPVILNVSEESFHLGVRKILRFVQDDIIVNQCPSGLNPSLPIQGLVFDLADVDFDFAAG